MTQAACEDFAFINKRLKEIPMEDTSVDVASTEQLNEIGELYGCSRDSGEGDYSYRQRVKRAIGDRHGFQL